MASLFFLNSSQNSCRRLRFGARGSYNWVSAGICLFNEFHVGFFVYMLIGYCLRFQVVRFRVSGKGEIRYLTPDTMIPETYINCRRSS